MDVEGQMEKIYHGLLHWPHSIYSHPSFQCKVDVPKTGEV